MERERKKEKKRKMKDTKDGGENSERKSCLKRVEIYSEIKD